MNTIFKPTLAVLVGMLSAVVEAVTPMFILAAAFVFADAVTAFRLQRRLAAAGKLDEKKARISSARFGKIFYTLAKIFGLLILTAMADHLVLSHFGLEAMRFVAGAICFWQGISLLENEAAQNDAPWAVHARKFLIDKAGRYLKEKC